MNFRLMKSLFSVCFSLLIILAVDSSGADGKIYIGQEINFKNNTKGPEGVKWEWDFGDGSSKDSRREPVHIYKKSGSYEVEVTAEVPGVGKLPSKKKKIVILGVTPQIDSDSKEVFLGQEIKFTNTTEGPAGMEWAWDFGDGETSTEKEPVHYYKSAPKKPVSLVVNVPNVGSLSPKQITIQVKKIEIQAKSKLDITRAGKTIGFINNSIGPNDMEWEWDFGDGAKSTEKEPTHSYDKPGDFQVTLKGTAPNIAPLLLDPPLAIKVTPFYVTPKISKIIIEPKELGEDGNYTARVIVNTEGTYSNLRLGVSAELLGAIKPPPAQKMEDSSSNEHTFLITLPNPEPSISQEAFTEELKISAVIFPDNPEDEKKDVGYVKESTLGITLIPQKPGWLIYAYLLAVCLTIALIALLVARSKRPLIPGYIMNFGSDGDDYYMSSSRVGGPKKGYIRVDLGKLDSQYAGYTFDVQAERNARKLSISCSVHAPADVVGDLDVNGQYETFGKMIRSSGVMSFEWRDEDGKLMSLRYDTAQEDNYDYDDYDDYQN